MLLTMNAESYFAPFWIREYLDHGVSVDLASTYSLERNKWMNQQHLQDVNTDLTEINAKVPLLNWKRLDYLLLGAKLVTRSRRENYDALHVHSLDIRGVLANFSSFKKLILSPYGSDVFQTNKWRIAPLLDNVTVSLMRRILNKANLILPTSDHMSETLQNEYGVNPSRIYTKSWGVNIQEWKSAIPPPDFIENITQGIEPARVVFFSYRTAREHYRLHWLPMIHKALESRGVKSHFIYVLRGETSREYLDRLVSEIRDFSLDCHSTLIFNSIHLNQLKGLLELSDYFFSIPTWDQLSATLLEGMYCGSIPIVSPMPAYAEVLDRSRAVVADTIKGFIQGIGTAVKQGMHKDRQTIASNRLVVQIDHDREKNMNMIMDRIVDTIRN